MSAVTLQNKAIKYRLYPNKEQETLFAKTFGCCRKVWNLMLGDKLASYEKTGLFSCGTPASYKQEYPYLKDVDSLALANVQMNLQAAFSNYFQKKEQGAKNPGFPKFKSKKKAKKAYATNNQSGSVRLEGNGIRLPKAGVVRAKLHRMPEDGWVIKSVTVSQDSAGNYFASVLFAFEAVIPDAVSLSGMENFKAIGLDYKSDGLYMNSDGHVGSNHKYFREGEKKLAKEQRKLSHKQEGSKNYGKQLKKVNKVYRKIANQRMDHLQKTSTGIANLYDVVCVETLDLRQIANKGFSNGKSTYDNGYGMFLNMLGYKLRDRGKLFVKVDRWFRSSQICSQCGEVHPEMKDLKNRRMSCKCGNSMDRDLNAAINIRNEGLRMLTEIPGIAI